MRNWLNMAKVITKKGFEKSSGKFRCSVGSELLQEPRCCKTLWDYIINVTSILANTAIFIHSDKFIAACHIAYSERKAPKLWFETYTEHTSEN